MKNSLAVFLFLTLFAGCSGFFQGPPKEADPGIVFFQGEEEFKVRFQALNSVKAFLPETDFFRQFSGSLYFENPEIFYAFFAFDDSEALILLSVSPLYGVQIRCSNLAFHLDTVFQELASGLRSSSRTLRTLSFYGEAGKTRFALYFTPKDFYPLSSGENRYRLATAGSLHPDPFRFMEAAQEVWVSSPVFEEEQLAEDLFSDPFRQVRIFAGSSSLIPARHETPPQILPFTVIRAKKLALTPALKSFEDSFFWKKESLIQDLIFLFSLPLGNTRGVSPLAEKDGMVLEIRGAIPELEGFLRQRGLAFEAPDPDFTLWLENEAIRLSSRGISGTVKVCKKPYGHENFCANAENFQDTGKTLNSGAVLSFSAEEMGGKGFLYCFRVGEKDREVLWPGIPENPGDLTLSEIMWAGSTSNAGTSAAGDDWFEIKNTTQKILNLTGLKFRRDETYWNIPVNRLLPPGGYFVFMATRTGIFAGTSLENLYADSDISLPGTGSYCLAIESSSGVLLDEVCAVPETGAYLKNQYSRSRVRNKEGIWEESAVPFLYQEYDQKTSGTPGYGTAQEF